jgi:hypothetical protein
VVCRYEIPARLKNQDNHTKLVNTINLAIKHVISGAPTLQAGIFGKDSSKPFWVQLRSLDLKEHVKWIYSNEPTVSEKAVQATVLEYLDMRYFDLDKKPGWKVIIMQHAASDILDILFVWNHPHGDGMSGKIFHKSLLQALDELHEDGPQCSPNLTLELTDSSVTFPPSIEDTVGLTISPSYMLKEAWKEYKPTSLFPRATDARWAPIRALPYKSHYEVITISDTILRKVLATCKGQETTLTGLLNSLVLVSMASHLEAKKAPGFASSTAIDQRRFVPAHSKKYPELVPANTIANYVSVMYHEYDEALLGDIRSKLAVNPTTGTGLLSEDLLDLLWTVAKRVREEISKRLEMGVHNDMVGLSKLVPDWRKKFLKDAKKPRALSWFLTNLGIFEAVSETESDSSNGVGTSWVRKRAQFTLSTEIPVAALLIGVASVKGGELVLTCTWQDTVVEAILVESLMLDLVKWLNQIGAEQRLQS